MKFFEENESIESSLSFSSCMEKIIRTEEAFDIILLLLIKSYSWAWNTTFDLIPIVEKWAWNYLVVKRVSL